MSYTDKYMAPGEKAIREKWFPRDDRFMTYTLPTFMSGVRASAGNAPSRPVQPDAATRPASSAASGVSGLVIAGLIGLAALCLLAPASADTDE